MVVRIKLEEEHDDQYFMVSYSIYEEKFGKDNNTHFRLTDQLSQLSVFNMPEAGVVYQVRRASCPAAEEPSCHPQSTQMGLQQRSGLGEEYCADTWASEPATLPAGHTKQTGRNHLTLKFLQLNQKK